MGFFSSLAWIIITFLFFTVMVAVISSLKTKEDNLDTAEGYFLASRSLPGVVIAGSLLLTNLSAEQLVGLNGQSWATNMSPIGWEVGSIFTLLILAYYFLPRYLKMGTTTIPALMEERFGKTTKLVFSGIIVVMYSILNLPVILYSGAVVFERIFDISGMIGCSKFAAVAGLCVVIGIVGGCYAIFGGLKAVAVSDTMPVLFQHYLQTAHFTDRQLGRLLSWADTASVMQNATIVITGDHRIFHAWINDEIREYGIRAHLPFGVNYAGCPFILAGPKVVSRTLQQGLQVDIFTTTLHAIGQSEYFWKGTGHNLLEDYTASASEGNLRRQISDKLIRTDYFGQIE